MDASGRLTPIIVKEPDKHGSDIEYNVNLKAELEIAHLHEKMDRLQMESISRLANIERQLQLSQKYAQSSR